MVLRIFDYRLPVDTHKLYDVNFYDDRIRTLVTHDSSMVDEWISEIKSFHRHRLHRLIVGLDLEWRPSFQRYIENPVATLQICVGRRCLIFQLLYASVFPQSLVEFLANSSYTFVGVGIDKDVEKLNDDHGLLVNSTVDLRNLAAESFRMRELRNTGLKGLAREVLGKEVQKPRNITMSRWDNEWLTPAQVQYACLDAFLSFEIGRRLNAADYRILNERNVGL